MLTLKSLLKGDFLGNKAFKHWMQEATYITYIKK